MNLTVTRDVCTCGNDDTLTGGVQKLRCVAAETTKTPNTYNMRFLKKLQVYIYYQYLLQVFITNTFITSIHLLQYLLPVYLVLKSKISNCSEK